MEQIFDFLLELLLLAALILSPSSDKLPTAQTAGETAMMVHFLDVGQADCALIECGGETLLIDGGNVDDGQMLVSYLDRYDITAIDHMICTHAHEDHVGGLPAVLAACQVEAVYAPVTEYDSNIYRDFVRYARQEGCGITVPEPGDSFTVGSARVTVLGPVKDYEDTNNTSIVVKITHGDCDFLFTGDMEVLAENDMLDAGMDVSADVLKVGHHGSETSTGYRFLYEVNPDYALISVGTGNTYGHPDAAPLARLRDAGTVLFRTDHLGTVMARSDGREITFTWENQTAQPERAEPGEETGPRYIGNRKSHKFHTPGCTSLPKGNNRVVFETYDEALAEGFVPCGSCFG